jgi:transposase
MEQQRHAMVAAVRAGASQRAVARRFAVPLATVQRWLQRAAGQALAEVDWRDQPRGPARPANRTPASLEERILQLRAELRHQSDLGEHGAVAIRRALQEQGLTSLPCVRTIGRILERHGLLDGRQRARHRPPPKGWYLPAVAAGQAELDAFDVVEGLKIQAGPLVEVLNAVSLHGGLVASWPREAAVTAREVRERLVAHWQEVGRPQYAQFDNDTIFQGPHQHRDVISSVMRTCLSLEVTPVFVPPRETGFQAAIESYNGLWQAKVWSRFGYASLEELRQQSARYVRAHRQRTHRRQAEAPERRPFPAGWQLDLQAPPRGRVVFIRRTSGSGEVTLLGRTFGVDPKWVGRLVRCEVGLTAGVIRCYQLRRRAPDEQPLLSEQPYDLPDRPFRE